MAKRMSIYIQCSSWKLKTTLIKLRKAPKAHIILSPQNQKNSVFQWKYGIFYKCVIFTENPCNFEGYLRFEEKGQFPKNFKYPWCNRYDNMSWPKKTIKYHPIVVQYKIESEIFRPLLYDGFCFQELYYILRSYHYWSFFLRVYAVASIVTRSGLMKMKYVRTTGEDKNANLHLLIFELYKFLAHQISHFHLYCIYWIIMWNYTHFEMRIMEILKLKRCIKTLYVERSETV